MKDAFMILFVGFASDASVIVLVVEKIENERWSMRDEEKD